MKKCWSQLRHLCGSLSVSRRPWDWRRNLELGTITLRTPRHARSSGPRSLNSEARFRDGAKSAHWGLSTFSILSAKVRLPLHTAVFHFTKGPDFQGVGGSDSANVDRGFLAEPHSSLNPKQSCTDYMWATHRFRMYADCTGFGDAACFRRKLASCTCPEDAASGRELLSFPGNGHNGGSQRSCSVRQDFCARHGA